MKNKIVALFLGIFLAGYSLLTPVFILAAAYGEGTYSLGNYNEGEVTPAPSAAATATPVSNSLTPAAPASCDDQAPGTAPVLYGSLSFGANSIQLNFTQAGSPVSKYVLEYGTKSGEYQYGVEDLGINENGQMSYLVGSLSPNTNYYFRVRGQNGCATGDWSNEISAKTKGFISFNQLEFSESELTVAEDDTSSADSCELYIVKSGDSLWAIAEDLLGDGNRYKEIIEQNKGDYPTLAKSNNLNAGWELSVDCAGKDLKSEDKIINGLSVNIKVVDTKKQPVEGAKVTLHSDPKEATTDKDGIAKFNEVEPGEHKVLIAYQNYEGEQSIFLNATEDQTDFNINITIEPKNILLSNQVIVIMGLMLLVIVVLITIIIRGKNRKI